MTDTSYTFTLFLLTKVAENNNITFRSVKYDFEGDWQYFNNDGGHLFHGPDDRLFRDHVDHLVDLKSGIND